MGQRRRWAPQGTCMLLEQWSVMPQLYKQQPTQPGKPARSTIAKISSLYYVTMSNFKSYYYYYYYLKNFLLRRAIIYKFTLESRTFPEKAIALNYYTKVELYTTIFGIIFRDPNCRNENINLFSGPKGPTQFGLFCCLGSLTSSGIIICAHL